MASRLHRWLERFLDWLDLRTVVIKHLHNCAPGDHLWLCPGKECASFQALVRQSHAPRTHPTGVPDDPPGPSPSTVRA
jgi:hypothetical protein